MCLLQLPFVQHLNQMIVISLAVRRLCLVCDSIENPVELYIVASSTILAMLKLEHQPRVNSVCEERTRCLIAPNLWHGSTSTRHNTVYRQNTRFINTQQFITQQWN